MSPGPMASRPEDFKLSCAEAVDAASNKTTAAPIRRRTGFELNCQRLQLKDGNR